MKLVIYLLFLLKQKRLFRSSKLNQNELRRKIISIPKTSPVIQNFFLPFSSLIKLLQESVTHYSSAPQFVDLIMKVSHCHVMEKYLCCPDNTNLHHCTSCMYNLLLGHSFFFVHQPISPFYFTHI